MRRDLWCSSNGSPLTSPPRSGAPRPTRLALSDPFTRSSSGYDMDEDFASPMSNFSPTGGGRHDSSDESNFKVVIRVRPPVPRELDGYRPFVDVVRIPKDSHSITLCETLDTEDGRGGVYSQQTFTFDYVYNKQSPQQEVYQRSAQPAVLSVLEGYNATLMAYGQTGTGKTYTMEGFTSEEQRGIIPRSIEDVFAHIDIGRHRNMRFLVRASYLQIYNEVISDLLNQTTGSLTVRHTPQRGVYVEGLSEWIVRTPQDVYDLIERGTSLRATSTTKMSELSSRSHAMFTVIVEIMEGDESNPTSYRFGKLNIVDLAGSEKVRQTGVTGQRLEETKKINKSLHELGNVISALASKSCGRNRHVPFRNSVLTSALRDSLGGNCKTTLIACISPALESYTESLSTLVFANRAKNIKNTAVINEDVDQATLLRKYEQELKLLRQQLQERGGGGGGGGGGGDTVGGLMDAGLVSELRQGMRRAEEDREAALEALHESSRAHQQEQLARRRLEERIQELEGMLQNGGFKGGPRTCNEYALRLDELDRERQVMEEDKAQVDRYKQLLLKQRDIMLNLTTRLNERDEAILQLQEEIDAYDAHIQTLEDTIETIQQQSQPSQQSKPHTPLFNAQDAGSFTRAQAEDFVARARAHTHSSGEASAYRSLSNPSQLISAEELMVEVLCATGRAPAEPTALAEARHMLLEHIRDRADAIVRRQLDEHHWQVCHELHAATARAAVAEQRCRALEQPRGADEPQEALRMAYEQRVLSLQQQLAKEREQRVRLTAELDRMAMETRQTMERCTSGAQRAEIGERCDELRRAEESIRREAEKAIAEAIARARAPLSSMHSNSSANGSTNANGRKSPNTSTNSSSNNSVNITHVLEERDDTIRQLREQLRVATAREEEIVVLTKALNTHKKDRRALQTIMEQRIKVKIDAICELLAAGPQEDRGRLSTEARALQNLVHASIKAMES